MANKRRATKVAAIKMVEPNCWLEIEVAYNEGGNQSWSGQNNRRGLYLHVTTVKIEGGFREFTIEPGYAGGTKCFLEEMARFSQKKMDEQAAKAMSHPRLAEMIYNVVNAKKWTIAPGEPFSNTTAPTAETPA